MTDSKPLPRDTESYETAPSPVSPEFAFDPTDPWTETFQKGLERAELRDKRVYEVGVGTGINVAFMLHICGAAAVAGSDLDPRLAQLAEANVRRLAPREADRFTPVHGEVSLIDHPEARTAVERADIVIGCLPQVGDPDDPRLSSFRRAQKVALADGAEDREADHLAHYYPWADFDAFPFNAVGLGLNEALLRRLRAVAPSAEVVLNFGARIGTEVICGLFEANGYTPEILHAQVVRQHAGTDFSFFVALEKALRGSGLDGDFACEFYADPEGRQHLTAIEAQERVDSDPDAPLFHEVCVIRGRPT
ncbi:s-adenosyl-l-methionine--l-methionine S-methyltransferase [Acidimangrovimonas sediminis]|uniref:s-adenosyl-l-methionine--l-methionine S-methyltransferase n=1 Tax=Acidimangrovimonas sediminis TaxID=2056283 RepID=UPI000C7FDDDF|nr:s-adenosyl-l-methionine--l-methionine S-methyltransferase [Acidimangrovimonas sediminis]